MLVKYKGWGYFDYEMDFDAMGTTQEELHSSGRCSEEEQWMESCIFELPKYAQIQIEHLKETDVNYLLLSEYSNHDEMNLEFHYPEKDEIRFYLCDEDSIYMDGHSQHREQKRVKYTIDDIYPEPLIDNVSKNQTKCLKYIGRISDQQETDTQQKQTSRRKRGQTKINIFLTELCQKQDIGSLSGETLVRAIKPLVDTPNCPAKKYHGFYDDVAIDWNSGTGSTQGSWGKKAFQNFVSEYKKNNH